MRELLIVFTLILTSGCSSIQIKGTIVNGKYTNPQGTFEMMAPNYVRVKIVDGIMPHHAYVDFIAFDESYSIEVYENVGIENEEDFRSGTETYMNHYIPNKDGANSYLPVTGRYSVISNNLSYDFVTTGIRKDGQERFWYGRSIYLGPKKVAICMFYKNREDKESLDTFKLSFNKTKFNNICSSIKIKI